MTHYVPYNWLSAFSCTRYKFCCNLSQMNHFVKSDDVKACLLNV